MTFIITLISLIIERFFHWSQLRYWHWFESYQGFFQRRLSNLSGPLLLVFMVLPLMIIVEMMNYVLGGWAYGIFKLLFGVLVLTYCLGPNNLWAQLYTCLNELKNDPKKAIETTQSVFNVPPQDHSQAFHQAFARAIFIEAQQRIFSVIFWFVILGPAGAVLYRVVALCADKNRADFSGVAQKTQQWLDWLPVRIVTFIFALGGHYTEVLPRWQRGLNTGVEMNEGLLAECGMAALDVNELDKLSEEGEVEKAVIELLDRVLVMILVILAVFVLII